jgi:hypothetical protein
MRDRAEALDVRAKALAAAVLPETADRAAILREAADAYDAIIDKSTGKEADPRYWSGVHDVAVGLRAMADAASDPGCPGHAECVRCDVTDPCPCCGLTYRNGQWAEQPASGPGGVAVETQQDDAPYPPSVEWRAETQRRGDHWITWHGVQYELAEARSDFAETVERDGGRHAWRLIRETTTYTVDAEQPAAVSQPDGKA